MKYRTSEIFVANITRADEAYQVIVGDCRKTWRKGALFKIAGTYGTLAFVEVAETAVRSGENCKRR